MSQNTLQEVKVFLNEEADRCVCVRMRMCVCLQVRCPSLEILRFQDESSTKLRTLLSPPSQVRVVSMPSVEVFRAQSDSYKEAALKPYSLLAFWRFSGIAAGRWRS